MTQTPSHRSSPHEKLISTATRFVMLGLCALISVWTLSCNDGVITFTGRTARVHIFNGCVKSASIDVYVDTLLQFPQLANGTMSSDLSLSSGVYHSFLCRKPSDTTLSGIIASQRYVLADDASYTVIVRGQVISDFIKPVLDSSVSPFPAKAALRIINATDTVFCDVKVDTIKINDIVADVQTSSRLYSVPPGKNVVSTLDVYNEAVIDHQTIDFQAGKVYHLFVYDAWSGSTVIRKVKIVEVTSL